MKIAIRMDDITPDMDWVKFEKFKAILDKHGVKPLIGVVPDNKDVKLKKNEPRKDFWEYIKSLQNDGWIVAMHGFNHVYTTKESGLFPIGDKSEFAGIPYQRQDEMIREGKRILKSHGIVTDFFMAPSHSYDRSTLKALVKNGFHKMTDGYGTEPYEMDGLTFYPISISRKKTLKSKKEGYVTFVFHTSAMSDREIEQTEKLFDRADIVSFDELYEQKSTTRGAGGALLEYITAKSKYIALWLKRELKRK